MSTYISNLLCHFVGRSLQTDDERFDLLIRIINEGKLKANLQKPDHPSISSSWNYSGERLGEIFEKCDCVCFCDIPDDMLNIHTQKYSKLGMGFDKTSLSMRGVRPVSYVPLHSIIKEASSTSTPISSPSEYYTYLSNLSNTLLPLLMLYNTSYPIANGLKSMAIHNPNIQEVLHSLDDSVTSSLLDGRAHQMLYSLLVGWATQNAYIKVFDETLALNDPDNYYMEREWRSIKSIDFKLDDIQKIYLPSAKYVERFKDIFPLFKGDFYIIP